MSMSRRDMLTGVAATAAAGSLMNLLGPEGSLAQARAAAKPLNLKITDIKTFLVAPRSIYVKVYTNQGIVGLGQAIQTSKENTVVAAIMEAKDALIGQDPTRIERTWEDLYQAPRWRGGPLVAAISAIEIAQWDILGQALGVPIYKLLGGAVHDKIKVYGGSGGITEESWAATKAAGYQSTRIQWPRGSVSEMIDYVKKVRIAAGPRHEIAIHGAGTLPTADAVQFMRGVEECNLLFVEEPIQMDDVEDWAHLRSKTSTPIATGERLLTKWAFQPLIQRHLIDFAQPDLCACGGILESRKIAAMAEANRIRMAPHNPHPPAGALATFHFDAATPNFYVQETRNYTSQFDMDVHEGMVPIIKDGYCELPDRPGLGTVLNEQAIKRQPYVQLSRGDGVGLGSGIPAVEQATRAEAAAARGGGGGFGPAQPRGE